MSQYESVYGVSLLDDLHNYFPDLLYNPTFESPAIAYLRRETRDRFDLFSRGERQWRAANPSVPAPGFGARGRASSFRPMTTSPIITPVHSTLPANSLANSNISTDFITSRILLSLMTLSPTSDSFLQPILVRPTAEQIASNTIIGHVGSDESVICAICQDTLSHEQEGRRLTSCGHWFHRNCIDTWFMRNVHCPNCRQDVRDIRSEE